MYTALLPLDDNDDISRGVNEYPFIFQAFFFLIPNKRFITVGSITIGCIFKLLMKNIQKNIMHILDISLLVYKNRPHVRPSIPYTRYYKYCFDIFKG